MELRDYVKIVSKNLWILIVVVIMTTLGAFWFTKMQPVTYDGSLSLNVTKVPEKGATNVYRYDQYYALEASSMMADTVASWLKDPSSVIEIYNNAQVELPTQSAADLSKIINAKKLPPSTITVLINGNNEGSLKNILSSTIKYIKSRVETDHSTLGTENFEVKYSDPAVLKHDSGLLLNTALGFIAGIIIGLALIALVDYFKRPAK